MSRPAPGLTLSEFLQRLAMEFGTMAGTADEVQSAAMELARGGSPDGRMRQSMPMALQSLDALTQILRDLERLAEAAQHQSIAGAAFDPEWIRQALVLNSLGDRLIGRMPEPDPQCADVLFQKSGQSPERLRMPGAPLQGQRRR